MSQRIPPRFKVHPTGPVREALLRWADWAEEQHALDDFKKALATLRYRLEHEADEWGEVEEELEHVPIIVKRGMVMMLEARFGLHLAGMQVFLTGIRFHHGPLGEERAE